MAAHVCPPSLLRDLRQEDNLSSGIQGLFRQHTETREEKEGGGGDRERQWQRGREKGTQRDQGETEGVRRGKEGRLKVK